MFIVEGANLLSAKTRIADRAALATIEAVIAGIIVTQTKAMFEKRTGIHSGGAEVAEAVILEKRPQAPRSVGEIEAAVPKTNAIIPDVNI